jgi:hypothetical protein
MYNQVLSGSSRLNLDIRKVVLGEDDPRRVSSVLAPIQPPPRADLVPSNIYCLTTEAMHVGTKRNSCFLVNIIQFSVFQPHEQN